MVSTAPTTATPDGDDQPSVRRPAGVRVVVALLAGVLAVLVVWSVVERGSTIVRAGYRSVTGPQRNLADSDLDPLSYFASTRALSGARDVIPPQATYALVVGKSRPSSVPLPGPALNASVSSIQRAFRLWLLPRMEVPLRRAQWVIAYDIPPQALGVNVAQTYELGPDATVVEVAR
jgi:hypothetical protein